jgi:hypothetical protein
MNDIDPSNTSNAPPNLYLKTPKTPSEAANFLQKTLQQTANGLDCPANHNPQKTSLTTAETDGFTLILTHHLHVQLTQHD